MDMWDSGYSDGLRDAVLTVQELAEEDPEMRVSEVLEALRSERELQCSLLRGSGFDPH